MCVCSDVIPGKSLNVVCSLISRVNTWDYSACGTGKVGSSVSIHHLLNELRHEKTCFGISENKGSDHHLCFSYIDSTIPLLPKSEISSL